MSTPTRKRSLSGPSGSVKKNKYKCKFQADWMKDFQFSRPSSLGNESSFCTLCSVNLSVASGGLYNVKRYHAVQLITSMMMITLQLALQQEPF